MYFPQDLEFDPNHYFKLRELEKSILLETFIPLIGTIASNKLLDRQKKVLDALKLTYL